MSISFWLFSNTLTILNTFPQRNPHASLGAVLLGGHVAATSLPSFLEELAAELEQHTQHAHAQSVLVGFSVGGYLVANFQDR